MDSMFYDCNKLKRIYVSYRFVTDELMPRYESQYYSYGDGLSMFYNCTQLKGGNGTSFNSAYTDKAYAHIDRPEEPGYFTEKVNTTGMIKLDKGRTYAAPETIDNENGKVTYSSAEVNYDDQGNEIHWVKDGDTWTYTFYVDNPDDTWYAWEDSIDGYKAYEQVVDVVNQKATIINYTEKWLSARLPPEKL